MIGGVSFVRERLRNNHGLRELLPFTWVGSLGYRQTGKTYSDTYVRARHYGSSIGRWTTKDPAKDDINLYSYVRNRVTSIIDPSGLFPSDKSQHCNVPGRHPIDPSLVNMGNFVCPNSTDLKRIACYCQSDQDQQHTQCTSDPAWGSAGPTQAITNCYDDCDLKPTRMHIG